MLGCAPAHQLFDLVEVAKKEEVDAPRAFTDYEIRIHRDALPPGVELMERP
jgi:CRISPR-associated protein Csd2